ncbi:MAG TPA: hypothetical protein PLK94_11460 [Alphaproteobacteria bacterium]|jgi:hypothetical protein|nr:hypothetical protein [Alphaproteobacteria bacterium]
MKDNPTAQLAKMTTLLCVRNTFLEDLHSGPMPISKTRDYSDVKVIDAEGNEIPWNQVSQLDNAEMKRFMKEVVNKLYTFNIDQTKFEDQFEILNSKQTICSGSFPS